MEPIDREAIRSRAKGLGLRLDSERDLDVLVALVEGNEVTFRPIDAMPLEPQHSPHAFVRWLERRRVRGGR